MNWHPLFDLPGLRQIVSGIGLRKDAWKRLVSRKNEGGLLASWGEFWIPIFIFLPFPEMIKSACSHSVDLFIFGFTMYACFFCRGHVVELAMNCYGTHVVQKALDCEEDIKVRCIRLSDFLFFQIDWHLLFHDGYSWWLFRNFFSVISQPRWRTSMQAMCGVK